MSDARRNKKKTIAMKRMLTFMILLSWTTLPKAVNASSTSGAGTGTGTGWFNKVFPGKDGNGNNNGVMDGDGDQKDKQLNQSMMGSGSGRPPLPPGPGGPFMPPPPPPQMGNVDQQQRQQQQQQQQPQNMLRIEVVQEIEMGMFQRLVPGIRVRQRHGHDTGDIGGTRSMGSMGDIGGKQEALRQQQQQV